MMKTPIDWDLAESIVDGIHVGSISWSDGSYMTNDAAWHWIEIRDGKRAPRTFCGMRPNGGTIQPSVMGTPCTRCARSAIRRIRDARPLERARRAQG